MKEEKKGKKERKFKKKKRKAKNDIICEEILEKSYCKYNNISDFELCIGGKTPSIKINFIDSRFNDFVTNICFL